MTSKIIFMYDVIELTWDDNDKMIILREWMETKKKSMLKILWIYSKVEKFFIIISLKRNYMNNQNPMQSQILIWAFPPKHKCMVITYFTCKTIFVRENLNYNSPFHGQDQNFIPLKISWPCANSTTKYTNAISVITRGWNDENFNNCLQFTFMI